MKMVVLSNTAVKASSYKDESLSYVGLCASCTTYVGICTSGRKQKIGDTREENDTRERTHDSRLGIGYGHLYISFNISDTNI